LPERAHPALALLLLLALPSAAAAAEGAGARVAATPGLIAFWDFQLRDAQGRWTSRWDPKAADRAYPVVLRRIGDPKAYVPATWPHQDENGRLELSDEGPFGKAVRFNQGFVFSEVPRAEFDRTPLDLTGRRPFTLLAWIRFTGKRHLVAGIWDEGGWDRYGGRRQVALFGGLFGSQGVIAHVSSTGAASFPQSQAKGAQYARMKAMDGASFANDRWVCMGMAYDGARGEVSAWLDGVCTPKSYADEVIRDVFGTRAEPVNPAAFTLPIFAPRAFLLKFNGYGLAADGVSEHRLHVDLDGRKLAYGRSGKAGRFQLRLAVRRGATAVMPALAWEVMGDAERELPDAAGAAKVGDEVVASLWQAAGDDWKQVGTEVKRTLSEGAPFTFGRALGLGAEELAHGSQLRMGGVAVFDRVLTAEEMKGLSFATAP
jgi:hypothetical protein